MSTTTITVFVSNEKMDELNVVLNRLGVKKSSLFKGYASYIIASKSLPTCLNAYITGGENIHEIYGRVGKKRRSFTLKISKEILVGAKKTMKSNNIKAQEAYRALILYIIEYEDIPSMLYKYIATSENTI